MAETYYAWGPIKAGEKNADPGDKVSAESLGISKDEFQQLVDSTAVKTQKYPKDVPLGMSPIDHLRAKVTDSETDELEKLSHAAELSIPLPEGVEVSVR